MGLLDKLRTELIDLIEWVDDSRHTLVWRFPRHQNEIKWGAQLIVRPGQMAVFVREGRIADVFAPGRHRLETRNLPLLSTLAGWYHGFESPFKAEVYFVTTRVLTELKWGTPNPVPLRDPDFGPLRVRGFGTYTLRARDPRALVERLVGTHASFDADEIQELLRAVIAESFADALAKTEAALLDVASRYAEIADSMRELVVARIDDEYGLEIPHLFLVNVSVPAEVEQALDTRATLASLGDIGRYQQYQLAQAIPVAAENPAGGIASAGVGIGMGFAVAQQWPNTLTPAAPSAPGAPSAPPPAPPAAWYVAAGGRSSGPFDAAELSRAATEGRFSGESLVWTAGFANWVPASRVPELAGLFAGPPPLPR